MQFGNLYLRRPQDVVAVAIHANTNSAVVKLHTRPFRLDTDDKSAKLLIAWLEENPPLSG